MELAKRALAAPGDRVDPHQLAVRELVQRLDEEGLLK